ncbi:MAG: twin-arginine translocase subunit TatA [Gammaproteobacteria bacterium]|nr:MAG: twin-arginine translocase subunit TatA [Gammaproteobacteria bacterium]
MAIGPLQIFLILMIIILLFGTKKLRNVGGDLGGAIKNFKKSMTEGQDQDPDETAATKIEENKGETIDAQFEEKKEEDSK